MMPMVASSAIHGAALTVASGKSGMLKRRKPYVPIFSRTPARMTEPAVGASTCASGSQECSGHIGTLIAKAAAKARNSHNWIFAGMPPCAINVRHREGVACDAKPEDGKQHQDGTSHRVQEELDRGIQAARAAPDADQEVHRDEGEFPEDVEQEQVLRQEHAHHAHFQQQEEDHEILDAVLHRRPRGEDGDGRQEGRQQDEQDAQAVHAR